ncbi:MAG TPA: succinyl-diaminopimelate desuccinylase [Geminicoccus sp.]|jgi:succinyl-diaminopimelate desuccinylase|uniref:succinyl-diaminopimelate desuccinylase n=1 Tax=Geminicoccus sp. TaxID=2024832 RepID=UPI002E347835|nr:succinyl-diaminopimelate desuccinylase [Geminicoccus sp.]HEX2525084.1 succinyl-diaminopimelate desuccinylase [Geminicoccus sp.]
MASPAPAGLDPVALAAALIRCPSVTPAEAGTLDLLAQALEGLGFAVHRVPVQKPGTERVDNLFARLGDTGPHLAFAGHVDVVPPGDSSAWSHDPFAGVIENGLLFGRGAADMKSGVAAFVAAVSAYLASHGRPAHGSVSLVITGDEEGPAVNGTEPLLRWMDEHGHRPDACLVGEPTSVEANGDMMKVGRRGSANGRLVVQGRQGHTAYPHRADNPAHRIVQMLARILGSPIDAGSEFFEPSNLQVTSIDIGNPAGNVIPAEATARFNIRYNDLQTRERLEAWLHGHCDAIGGSYRLELSSSGDAFLTPPGPFTKLVAAAAEACFGRRPEASTSGGTSDARFVKQYCPVVELGLVGRTMHQVNEHVRTEDIVSLTACYRTILERWFATARNGG